MCLQLCHVRQIILDNDLSCSPHCPPIYREAHSEDSCVMCAHRVDRKIEGKGALCNLTRLPLPKAQRCCHWNATILTDEKMIVTPDTLAPGLMRAHRVQSVSELFGVVENTAETFVVRDQNSVEVMVRDLALPDQYGVPDYEWERALSTTSRLKVAASLD